MGASGEVTNREALIAELSDAAELEHTVICQYLFAAHSLKSHPSEHGVTAAELERSREWQANILAVARGEMEHLGLVCNLLSAVGGTPYFRRRNLPREDRFCPPGTRFELLPFGKAALEKFMQVEKLHAVASDFPERDKKNAQHFETIGDLYGKIRRGFERLEGSGPPLFVGHEASQITNQHIDLTPGWHDMDLVPVTDLPGALTVIDRIVEAGHDPEGDASPTHYERFARTLDEFKAWQKSYPKFRPVRPVVTNPITRDEPGVSGTPCTPIDHPISLKAAVLFNAAYETMILMLGRYYTPTDETPSEHAALGKMAIYPLMTVVLRPLAEMLTRMPIDESDSGLTAGPTFEFYRDTELQPHKRSAWFFLQERLEHLVEQCEALQGDVAAAAEPWSVSIEPRLAFLKANLESCAARFEHYMQTRLRGARLHFKKITGA